MLKRILLVDDDPIFIKLFSQLCDVGHQLHVFSQPVDALRWFWRSADRPAVVFVTLDPPCLSYAAEEAFGLLTYFMRLHAHIKIAVVYRNECPDRYKTERSGIYAVLSKRCTSDELRHQLVLLFENSPLRLLKPLKPPILGRSSACKILNAQIEHYALAPFPVLISGPTGSGKELVARGLHGASARADQPFLAINCAAISPSLFESLLFGHARGAFTGAAAAKTGILEDAGSGTLFLDEIGEMSLELQAKLLRVLDDGEFQRVGESQSRKFKARVLTATHRKLFDLVETGRFRHDLYYRLSVLTIDVPALNQRSDDTVILWDHFASVVADELRVEVCRLAPCAKDFLLNYAFPGNVRELKNIVIRLHSKYPGLDVTVDRLLPETDAYAKHSSKDSLGRDLALLCKEQVFSRPDFNLDNMLSSCEETLIRSALEQTKHNIAATARLLGLNRTTLYGRLDRLGISQAYFNERNEVA